MGKEYLHKDCQAWFKEGEIRYELTTAHSPESNGSTERLKRTFVHFFCKKHDVAVALCAFVQLLIPTADALCVEGINMASFVRNRLVSKNCAIDCRNYKLIQKHKTDVSNFI